VSLCLVCFHGFFVVSVSDDSWRVLRCIYIYANAIGGFDVTIYVDASLAAFMPKAFYCHYKTLHTLCTSFYQQ